ncbi:MAG: hypothetical protein ABI743_05270 [bacterium]
MKKRLLTAHDLTTSPPATIDLDSVILTPSARTLAERQGIPMIKSGQALEMGRAGSSKTGGPGAGDYTLMRPQFIPSGHVPRFGNPTHTDEAPPYGSKAWRASQGGQELEQLRRLVADRLGPRATPQTIEAGVQEILQRLGVPPPSGAAAPARGGASLGGALQPGGGSPYAPAAPCGCPTTTPVVLSTSGATSHRGEDGAVHVCFPPDGTYLVRINKGQAKISEVVD